MMSVFMFVSFDNMFIPLNLNHFLRELVSTSYYSVESLQACMNFRPFLCNHVQEFSCMCLEHYSLLLSDVLIKEPRHHTVPGLQCNAFYCSCNSKRQHNADFITWCSHPDHQMPTACNHTSCWNIWSFLDQLRSGHLKAHDSIRTASVRKKHVCLCWCPCTH